MKKINFDLDIYSYQIDCIGQVHNAAYINWMEIGRLKMLDAIGLPFSALISQGSIPALDQTSITYKSPLFLSDRVWVETWLSAIGYRSIVMCFNFFNSAFDAEKLRSQTLVAEGYQKNVFVNKDSHKSRLLTREEKNAFLPYLKEQSIDKTDLLPRQPRAQERKGQPHPS
jgi:acyl-CoA thioester hydrolase